MISGDPRSLSHDGLDDALVVNPLGVEQHVVVDDDVVSDLDLVGVSQHHVLPERHAPPTLAEHERIELAPQEQAERPGNPGPEHHELV